MTKQEKVLGVGEVSVSEAARRLKWHRAFVYGALQALDIHPRDGRARNGRMAVLITAAEFKRLESAVAGRARKGA